MIDAIEKGDVISALLMIPNHIGVNEHNIDCDSPLHVAFESGSSSVPDALIVELIANISYLKF